MPTRRRIPLLRDRHNHPMLYAALADGVDLNTPAVATRDDAVGCIRTRAQARTSDWTIATGWHSGRYPLQKSDFDDLPPVIVLNLSLHGLLANDEARAAIRRRDAAVADHLDDQDWTERNLRRVLNVFANAGASAARLRSFFDDLLHTHGVYHAEEMLLVGEHEIAMFDEAGLADRTRFWAAPELYEACSAAAKERIHGIKLFADGAIGVSTAALHHPYRTTGGCGLLLYTDDELRATVSRYAWRTPIAIHAIGDRAIDHVVSVVERVASTSDRRPDVRIEHAQLISRETARRAKALGLTLCMQPNFSEDSVAYADRLPDGAPARNNPFRILIDDVGFRCGEDLIFGSDGMPQGAREALRQSLFPDGGHADQVLTLEEFVAGYCLPDLAAGHLDVEIDERNRTVTLASTVL